MKETLRTLLLSETSEGWIGVNREGLSGEEIEAARAILVDKRIRFFEAELYESLNLDSSIWIGFGSEGPGAVADMTDEDEPGLTFGEAIDAFEPGHYCVYDNRTGEIIDRLEVK